MSTKILLAILFLSPCAGAQVQLPDGPGKEETERICKGCHEVSRSVSLRQDRDGWSNTMRKMIAMGTKATDKELDAIFEYLAKNYPAGEVPPLNVNKASAIDFESALSLRRSQANTIIQYRKQHGAFKSIEDLKKVPGIESAKIEAKKDRIVF